MPVKNGLDPARKILSISPGIGIVLFTAHGSEQLLTEARGIGIRAVVPKDGKTSVDDLIVALREIPRAA
jgi:DNA-binding NarL/FixJ family response regulator